MSRCFAGKAFIKQYDFLKQTPNQQRGCILEETNTSHFGKRKTIFQSALGKGYVIIPWRVCLVPVNASNFYPCPRQTMADLPPETLGSIVRFNGSIITLAKVLLFQIWIGHTPENWHNTEKWMVGIPVSFWDGLYSQAILVSGSIVTKTIGWLISCEWWFRLSYEGFPFANDYFGMWT